MTAMNRADDNAAATSDRRDAPAPTATAVDVQAGAGAGTVRRFVPHGGGAAAAAFGWEAVELLRYKEEGSAPFKDVTRQVLFAQPDQAAELRYFEVGAGGYSTLERHQHTHAVLILRGRGTVRIGAATYAVGERDLVTIDPMTWHQFAADPDAPLGFLCLVSKERDRPQLPTEQQAAALQAAADGPR